MTSNIPVVNEVSKTGENDYERMFTDQQLKELVTPAGDKISAALKQGKIDTARQLCTMSKSGHFPLAFGYFNWNSKMLVHLYRAYGAETLFDCIDSGLAPWFKPLVELFRNGVTREAITILVQHWRMASKSIGEVVETDESIHFSVEVFDDFWRLNQFDQVGNVALPAKLIRCYSDASMAQEPFALLAQAALQGEALMTQWLGYPAFTIDFNSSSEPCRVTVYKDPLDIPEDRFDRIGASRDVRRIRGAVDVKGGRLFNDKELNKLNTDAFDLALSAIDAADIPLAIGYAQQSKNEWYPAHHGLRDWITGMLSYVYRRYGVDDTHTAVKESYEKPNAKLTLDIASQQNLREQVEGLAAGFLQHAMRFRIEEDADKFTFITEPCGSGGRLLDEGAYAWPKNFALIKESHESTFYLEDFPVYCMHCPSTNIQIFERGGPYYLLVDGQLMTVPDGNCNFFIFKNPDAIPEHFYSLANRLKPPCGSCS